MRGAPWPWSLLVDARLLPQAAWSPNADVAAFLIRQAAAQIALGLQTNATLEVLDLSGCNLGEGCAALGDALRANTALKERAQVIGPTSGAAEPSEQP